MQPKKGRKKQQGGAGGPDVDLRVCCSLPTRERSQRIFAETLFADRSTPFARRPVLCSAETEAWKSAESGRSESTPRGLQRRK